MGDILVVTSKVKAVGKTQDLRTSAEFITHLSNMVERKVNEAAKVAVAAGRKTIMAEDLKDSP